jgi:hypothetical protein
VCGIQRPKAHVNEARQFRDQPDTGTATATADRDGEPAACRQVGDACEFKTDPTLEAIGIVRQPDR